MVPLVKFCGCMSLRMGCIILGLLELLFYSIAMGSKPSFVYIFEIGCSCALVIGILKNSRNFFWPWMVWRFIQTVALAMVLSLIVLCSTVYLILGKNIGLSAVSETNIVASVGSLGLIAVILGSFYSFWVVYSHFIEMRDLEMRPIPTAPLV